MSRTVTAGLAAPAPPRLRCLHTCRALPGWRMDSARVDPLRKIASLSAAALVFVASLAPPPILDFPGARSDAEARATLTAEEKRVVEMFKRTRPSCVFITTLAKARDTFTKDVLDVPQGEGTGFVWDKEGHIVTNLHVVNGSKFVRVTITPDEGDPVDYDGILVGSDGDKDVAVLKLAAPEEVRKSLRPVKIGTSEDLQVGQRVYAIGNPFGLDHTLTSGLISAVRREIASGITGRPITGIIQTDAAINPGNSGGPLLDSSGEVVGMATAIYSASGASNGVGFAVGVDAIKDSVDQILTRGRVIRPVLGISFAPDATSGQLGIQGILVLDCMPNGPADRAGIKGTSRDTYGRLRLGDIIIGVAGKPVRVAADLYRVLDTLEVGQTIQIEVLKADKDKPTMLDVTLDGRDTSMM